MGDNFIDPSLDPHDRATWLERSQALYEAVGRIPECYRGVVRLYFMGLTMEEIGGELNINVDTVKSRLRRGRILIEKAMHDAGVVQ